MVRDGGEQFFLVFAVERRLTDQHFVQQNPVRPPIDRFAVRLIQNDLRQKSSTLGKKSVALIDNYPSLRE